jgi:hypothetical protein
MLMHENAKTWESVQQKLREARFFLVLMADHEQALATEGFFFGVSAFLSAFRSIAYKLYGVTENKLGKQAKVDLMRDLHTHPLIGFLIESSNTEVHSDGVRLWQRYTIHYEERIPSRWGSRFIRKPRFASRFKTPYKGLKVSYRAIDWQFEERPTNLIELCHDALDAIEEFARQVLNAEPVATQGPTDVAIHG